MESSSLKGGNNDTDTRRAPRRLRGQVRVFLLGFAALMVSSSILSFLDSSDGSSTLGSVSTKPTVERNSSSNATAQPAPSIGRREVKYRAVGSSPSLFRPNQTSLNYCSENNFVPLAGEPAIALTPNNSRPFSIGNDDFEAFNGRYCESVDELLLAIKNGRRRWDPSVEANASLSLLERESIPSVFVPDGCDVPLHSSQETCRILNQFSHVVMQGDSLSRHQQGGLLMNLRDDVAAGSIQSSQKGMYNCTCDAQFSEMNRCRLNDGLYNRFKPHQLGVCPEIGEEENQFESVFNINRLHRGVYNFPGVNCTDPSSRGLFLVVQGGVHLKYDAKSTWRSLLNRFLQSRVVKECARYNKVAMVFASYHSQSVSYDTKYPFQTLARGLQFNEGMERLINNSNDTTNLLTIDWAKFTRGAMHTDGLHFAANTNYFKAQHLVALAELMVKERRYLKLPE